MHRQRAFKLPAATAANTDTAPRLLCSNCQADAMLPPAYGPSGPFVVCADCGHSSPVHAERGVAIGSTSTLAA